MISIAFLIFIVLSTGAFSWGYEQAGYENASVWIIVFGAFRLLAQWRKWKWFPAPAVFISLFLAAYGVWFKFAPGLMFSGLIFSVLSWSLTEFQQKLRMLPQREDKAGMTRRHIIRVGFLSVGAILIALLLGIRG
ncbi:MAG: hypothetical protein ACKOBL_07915 [Chloroflexota bacterium]